MYTGQEPDKYKGTPEDVYYTIATSSDTKKAPKKRGRNTDFIDEVSYLKWLSGL